MGSRKFLALFALCALVPLAAAWLSLHLGWFAAAPTANHGEWLAQELRLLPEPGSGSGQWRLVYLPAADDAPACDAGRGAATLQTVAHPVPAAPPRAPGARCEQALLILRQLHAGLGRKQTRVQPLVLAARSPPALARFPQVQWLPGRVADAALEGSIVLVDPHGLALLRYRVEPGLQQAQRVAGDIRSDLLRLIGYERSGT